MVVYNTPQCWRKSIDRGAGTLPAVCPAGYVNNAGLCYEPCAPGFSDHGTATCTRDCPSGYTDTGLTCHYNGVGSYSPVHWSSCASRAPGWLGGGCIGGTVTDSCQSGYTNVASMCYIQVPSGFTGSALDPLKGGTYSRTGRSPSCASGLVMDAGLCYSPPPAGYTCAATACQQNCPSGLLCFRRTNVCTERSRYDHFSYVSRNERGNWRHSRRSH